MISKKSIALCATAGVVLSGFAFAVPAQADVVSNSYAVVGSDTLEDVVGALANGTTITGPTVRTAVNFTNIGSFDATGSSYIQTKNSGVRFGRPNGSGDGVKALSRSIDGAAYTSGTAGSPVNVTITGNVDIARSSSAGTANVAGELLYVPFGRDAIAYAYKGTTTGISTLTASQMKSLYECSVTTIGGNTVTPVIPQAGSGTRKDFLAKIGSTEALMLTVGESGCVVEGQEHDANSLVAANTVMPMAASRWIAMNTGASYDKTNGATLGSLVTGQAAVTGTGTSMVPNPDYYVDTTWGRDTYLVVEYARVDSTNGKYDANLAKLMDASVANSLANTASNLTSKSGSVKKKFGFLAPTTGVVAYRVAKTA